MYKGAKVDFEALRDKVGQTENEVLRMDKTLQSAGGAFHDFKSRVERLEATLSNASAMLVDAILPPEIQVTEANDQAQAQQAPAASPEVASAAVAGAGSAPTHKTVKTKATATKPVAKKDKSDKS